MVLLIFIYTHSLTVSHTLLSTLGNIDNKSSINNGGICCSTTKYSAKSKRKNSNLSQQEFDKKSAFSNNNNSEHFDGIAQIIASTEHQMTLKPKKSAKDDKNSAKEKLHGSLPNHLDTDVDGYEGSDDTNSSSKYLLNLIAIHYII